MIDHLGLKKRLFIALIVMALLATGCTTPATSKDTSAAKSGDPVPFGGEAAKIPVVSVFPREATVDLDRPVLLLRANINSQAIPGPADASPYTVQWSLGAVLISTDTALTEKPFLKAINNRPGTYEVHLTILTKASGARIGESKATVTVKKDEKTEPVIVKRWNYVSTTKGKGMRYWIVWNDGAEWWEGDADLRFQGTSSSGSLTFTIVSAAAHMPAQSKMIGQKKVFTFTDWKDDGKNASFTYKTPSGQVYTFRLVRQADGRLTGSMDAPETKFSGGTLPPMKGSLDLKPVP